MGITGILRKKIIAYFENKPEIVAVYLYGSQTKNTARANSDIDLAVLVENKESFSGFDIPQTRYTYDLEKLTGRKVEVQDLESVSIDFAHRVLSEGELLLVSVLGLKNQRKTWQKLSGCFIGRKY